MSLHSRFHCFLERPSAALHVFIFPHAGGGVHTYKDWGNLLDKNIELFCASYPERGLRTKHLMPSTFSALVNDFSNAIEEQADRPFALVGHSMGALLIFEITRELIRRKSQLPIHIFLSSISPPHLISANNSMYAELANMELNAFIFHVKKKGWLPNLETDDPEILSIVLKPLLKDVSIFSTYSFDSKDKLDKLTVACTIISGTKDPGLPIEDVKAWDVLQWIPKPRYQFIPDAGHFHTETHTKEFVDTINTTLLNVLDSLPRAIVYGTCKPWEDPNKFLHTLFYERAQLFPNSLAVVDFDGTEVTNSTLVSHAHMIGRLLQSWCVGKKVVVTFLPTSAVCIAAFYGIWTLGLSVISFYLSYSTSLILDLLTLLDCTCILTTQELMKNLPPEYQTEERCFCLDSGWFEDLKKRKLPQLKPVKVSRQSIALYSFSSGTTGKPKAIEVPHSAFLDCLRMRYDSMPYDPNEREATNIFFSWEFWRSLPKGIPQYIISDVLIKDPMKLANFLSKNRITRLMLTSSFTENLLQLVPNIGDLLQNLKLLMLCGEVVTQSLVNQFTKTLPRADLCNIYSSWESLEISESHFNPLCDRLKGRSTNTPKLSQRQVSKFASCGFVYPNVTAFIVDPDEKSGTRLQPRGIWGRIKTASPGMALGYTGDLEKTKKKFFRGKVSDLPDPIPSNWDKNMAITIYDNGDIGRIKLNGEIEVRGRGDGTIKIRGFKINLTWVESAVGSCEGVAAVCIRQKKNIKSEKIEYLIAYVVVKQGYKSDSIFATSVMTHVKDVLPEYAVPEYIIALKSFPIRAGSLKLDYKKLPDPKDRPENMASKSQKSENEETKKSKFVDNALVKTLVHSWEVILKLEEGEVDSNDNFFLVGGNSLLAAQLIADLSSRLGFASLSVLDLFQNPTPISLAEYIQQGADLNVAMPSTELETRRNKYRQREDTAVAIIGMAGMFPGAKSIDEFWKNLKNGHDSLRHFSKEELSKRGVLPEVYNHKDWVSAGQVVDNADCFDAYFWGMGAQEARITDPQQRLFLQTAYHALENAGYAPKQGTPHDTGVFAACGIDGYLINNQRGGGLHEPLNPGKLFMTEVGNEKDYIATRVSYNLDLGGPSFTINSACSSGLVAISQAYESILAGNCDMAVAGASSICFPNFGYTYSDGLVLSKDGTVRPFDEEASGTVFGDCVAAVVLKPLQDAITDGDTIYSVMSGACVTNDGNQKAGYSAPNSKAQKKAMVRAQEMAKVKFSDITYLECHATATKVGDAIEMRGITQAFNEHCKVTSGLENQDANRPNNIKNVDMEWSKYIALGSVKGNIGHANCAAGITGFIKTVLCLYHKQLVPTVHFNKLNRKLKPILHKSPFYVNDKLKKWKLPLRSEMSKIQKDDDGSTIKKRIAGVSSFGVGGTNCHIILSEMEGTKALQNSDTKKEENDCYILPVSAKTPESLLQSLLSLITCFREIKTCNEDSPVRLCDVAWTLQKGRDVFGCKFAATVSSFDEAIAKFEEKSKEIMKSLADNENDGNFQERKKI